MTAFYSTGTVSVTNGEARIWAEDPALWIPANIKTGDTFQTAEIPPTVIVAGPEFDDDEEAYWIDLAFSYGGTTGTGVAYVIVKTSSEWGTNQTLAEETAALIQSYAAGQITEEQLNDAVAAAQAAQGGAEGALATMNATYLGPQSSDPSVDLNGDPVTAGQFYYNTTTGLMRVRGASSWSNMAAGSQGIQGVGAGLQYTSMTSTTDSDPGGPGNFRFNNTDHSLATKAWFDNTDINNVSVSAVVDSWGTGSSAIKGHLFVWNRTNRAIFRYYEVTGATVDKAGYREVPLNYIAGAGTLTNGTATEVVFVPTGDKGDAGDAGRTSGVPYTFSTTTTDADPGAGSVRLDSATFGSVTEAFFGNADSSGGTQTGWLDSLGSVANANTRGYLRAQSPTTAAIFAEFAVVGAVVDGGGYRKVPLSPISGDIPINGQELVWVFAPAGLDGQAVDGTDPGILLNFSTSTTDGNPGSGFIRADNATLTSAGQFFVNKSNRAGNPIATFLAGLADSTNPTYKGKGSLTRASDGAQVTFKVTGVTDASTYVKVDISSVGGVASFDNNDPVSFQFSPAGDVGASGDGSFSGPASSTAGHVMVFADGSGANGDDSGVHIDDVARNSDNLANIDDKQAAYDELSLKGADIASTAALDLDEASGSLIRITGTVATTSIILTSGRYRRLIADAAWPITAGANLVINNGGSSYTCAAGDQIDVFADGAVKRLTVTPASGASPGALSASYLDTDGALTANSDLKVPSQKAVKTFVEGRGKVEVGTVVDYAGGTAPSKWLFLYGQNVSRTTYAALFAALGTAFGPGDGSTTFTLPDARGRVVAGKDNMGGTSANRLTSPINGDTLGASGGAEAHTLSTSEMPSHTHSGTTSSDSHGHTGTTASAGTHSHTWAAKGAAGSNTERTAPGGGGTDDNPSTSSAGAHTHTFTTSSDSHSHTFTTGSAGSGGSHNNMQPTLVLNKIIYAGV